MVARVAQANVARHCVEASAILAESRPEQYTLIGICGRQSEGRDGKRRQEGVLSQKLYITRLSELGKLLRFFLPQFLL